MKRRRILFWRVLLVLGLLTGGSGYAAPGVACAGEPVQGMTHQAAFTEPAGPSQASPSTCCKHGMDTAATCGTAGCPACNLNPVSVPVLQHATQAVFRIAHVKEASDLYVHHEPVRQRPPRRSI
ncbi:MAG: hypothetical protein P8Y64_09675 [Gammaproteobacteria bacterium]|jgi:hypothetical protein